jgi:hypothetical protein
MDMRCPLVRLSIIYVGEGQFLCEEKEGLLGYLKPGLLASPLKGTVLSKPQSQFAHLSSGQAKQYILFFFLYWGVELRALFLLGKASTP